MRMSFACRLPHHRSPLQARHANLPWFLFRTALSSDSASSTSIFSSATDSITTPPSRRRCRHFTTSFRRARSATSACRAASLTSVCHLTTSLHVLWELLLTSCRLSLSVHQMQNYAINNRLTPFISSVCPSFRFRPGLDRFRSGLEDRYS
jgi:hypothetical protein